jgi:hypothetical protein
VLIKNFATTGSFMTLPGAPQVVGAQGTMPLLVPAAAVTGCPAVSHSSDYKTITMDFSACTNMSGSISVVTTVDASGAYHATFTYTKFGYTFGDTSGSLNGQMTMDGSVANGASQTFHLKDSGLTGTVTTGATSYTWTETVDLTTVMTAAGSTFSMQEYGNLAYSGSFGTYSASIAQSEALTWSNFVACPYATSGTIHWTTNGITYTSTFTSDCGGFAVAGQAFPASSPAPAPTALCSVTPVAGNGSAGSADGKGTAASFGDINGLTVDPAGNIFLADGLYGTIRKVTPDGAVTTFAGTPGVLGTADGTGPNATFKKPSALAMDGAGYLYVEDSLSYSIRKITTDGQVSTLLWSKVFAVGDGLAVDGAGDIFFLSGIVPNRQGLDGQHTEMIPNGVPFPIKNTRNLAVDGSGNLFVADDGNQLIFKITPNLTLSTLAGGGLGWGDGTGTAAGFMVLKGMATDPAGNVYVIDLGKIRKITPAGVVTTLGRKAADGTVSTVYFNTANGIGTDKSGALYVVDNYVLYKIVLQ